MSIILFLLGFLAGSLLPLFDGFLEFVAKKIGYDRRGKK